MAVVSCLIYGFPQEKVKPGFQIYWKLRSSGVNWGCVGGLRLPTHPQPFFNCVSPIYIEWLNSLVEDEQIQRDLVIESPMAHPCVLFRRKIILEAGAYQDHGWAEDYDLWLRLCLAERQRGFGERA